MLRLTDSESVAMADQRRRMLEELSRERPDGFRPTFIHGDYTTDHVLFAGRRLTGVVDWATATFGDPLYDVAQALFLPGMDSADDFAITEDVAEFFIGYGTPPAPVETLRFYQRLYDLGGRGWFYDEGCAPPVP